MDGQNWSACIWDSKPWVLVGMSQGVVECPYSPFIRNLGVRRGQQQFSKSSPVWFQCAARTEKPCSRVFRNFLSLSIIISTASTHWEPTTSSFIQHSLLSEALWRLEELSPLVCFGLNGHPELISQSEVPVSYPIPLSWVSISSCVYSILFSWCFSFRK